MEELIKALNELFDNALKVGIIEYPEDPEHLYFKNDNDLYRKVDELCNQLLIDDKRYCNWTNINALRNAGFRVFPGDKDGFGWLVGCIQRNGDRKLTFTYG